MKRIVSICLIMCLLLTAIPGVSVAETKYGTVHGGWLRLRASASFEAATLSSYYTGTVVTILGTSGSWYHVRTPDGRTGYMHSSYVTSGGGSGGSTDSARVWSSNGYGVRLRSGPSTSYRILAVYSVGTRVTILERGAYWSRIQIGSRTGYMMNQFLVGGSIPTPEPSPTGNATIWSANGYGVRLRTGPSKSHSVIGVYSVGTPVTILEKGTVWDKIQVGSRVGYMMNEFLRYHSNMQVTNVALNTYTPVVGTILQASAVTPAGAEVRYSWLVGGVQVSTAATYQTTIADLGKQIQLKVDGINAYSGSATSPATAAVTVVEDIQNVRLNLDPATDAPVIGTTVRVDSFTPAGATVRYEWVQQGTGTVLSQSSSWNVTNINPKGVELKIIGTGAFAGKETTISLKDVVQNAQITQARIFVGGQPLPPGTPPNVGDVLSAVLSPANADALYEWSWGPAATDKAATQTLTLDAARHANKPITLTVTEKTGSPYYIGTEATLNETIVLPATLPVTDMSRITTAMVQVSATYNGNATPLTNLLYDASKPTVLSAVGTTVVPASAVALEFAWSTDQVTFTPGPYTVQAADAGKTLWLRAKAGSGCTVLTGELIIEVGKVRQLLTAADIAFVPSVVASPVGSSTLALNLAASGDADAGLEYVWARTWDGSSWSVNSNETASTYHFKHTSDQGIVGLRVTVKDRAGVKYTTGGADITVAYSDSATLASLIANLPAASNTIGDVFEQAEIAPSYNDVFKNPEVGQVLRVSGIPDEVAASYHWMWSDATDAPLSTDNLSEYTIKASDEGKIIAVFIVAGGKSIDLKLTDHPVAAAPAGTVEDPDGEGEAPVSDSPSLTEPIPGEENEQGALPIPDEGNEQDALPIPGEGNEQDALPIPGEGNELDAMQMPDEENELDALPIPDEVDEQQSDLNFSSIVEPQKAPEIVPSPEEMLQEILHDMRVVTANNGTILRVTDVPEGAIYFWSDKTSAETYALKETDTEVKVTVSFQYNGEMITHNLMYTVR